ncbi:3-hydroxyacyl-CoA dehydrogenase [Campylobacter jejuni]|nr:3-hydroxyacyl-CoA dehydrogenase [Campylobacter jejuni]EAI3983859.1 3-hydroxyacyl-CoA dehydrogenase [Campylobacter jejuni]EAK0278262.1 3-hydroxyacyl-CoA dehydrogenase [Campylobacter jejuni]
MKEINIIGFGLMGRQISALFYLLGYEIGVYSKSKPNIYEFEKQIKLLQRKIDFSNFNSGKINIYQHIEDLKNSLTIESLNEDLNLKKEIIQILRDNNNIVFSNSSSLGVDDLNCDFIHFFNPIYIKLIELCDKICKNLKEEDENFYHPKIFKKALEKGILGRKIKQK